MLKLIFTILCMIICWAAQAQQVAMRMMNGSFEEFEVNNGVPWLEPNVMDFYTPFIGDTLYHWFSRTNVVWIQDGECLNSEYGNFSVDTLIKPVEGTKYVCFNELKLYPFEVYRVGNVSQVLPCELKKGIKYKISLYATVDSLGLIKRIIDASIGSCEFDTIYFNPVPTLSLMLGTLNLVYDFRDWEARKANSNNQYILNQLPLTKKIWKKIEVEFIPEQNFDLISFVAIHDPCLPCLSGASVFGWSTLVLDNVSDIYYAEPTFLLPPDDTLTIGDCYQVEPYNIHPNPAEHKWEILGSNNVFHVGADPLLCPTQTTTYLVRSHDECGWAEADTFTLFVKEKPTIPVAPTSELVLYPNPGSPDGQIQIRSSHSGSFRFFDASGRLIGNYAVVVGEQVLNVSLASGIYFYQALLSDQSRKHGKYLVGRK